MEKIGFNRVTWLKEKKGCDSNSALTHNIILWWIKN